MHSFDIMTPDGLAVAADWDDPAGPSIVFMQGASQCAVAWIRRSGDGGVREFRMVLYDLRGASRPD
jgi:hypothetical protein